jgi:hypothetical protein
MGNSNDIYVVPGPDAQTNETGVAGFQGDNAPGTTEVDLPNNLFSQQPTATNFGNSTINGVSYFFNTSLPRFEPVYTTQGVSKGAFPGSGDFASLCQARTRTGNETSTSFLTEISNYESDLVFRKSLRDEMVNGGNTPALEAQILFAESQQEYQQLYQDLMALSPYVEDQLLIEVCMLENYPELALRNLLVANPHASRNPEIWDILRNINPPLSQQTLDDIHNGQQTYTAFDVLSMQLDIAQGGSEFATVQLVDLWSSDTVVNRASSIVNHLTTKDEAHFRFSAIDAMLAQGQTANAGIELDSMQYKVDFQESGFQYEEISGLVSFYNIVLGVIQDPSRRLDSLTIQELNSLQSIQGLNSENKAGSKAQALLKLNGIFPDYSEPVYLPEDLMERSSLNQGARPKNFIPNFVLSPNPARDKVTLSWFEVALVDKGILDLTVYNVMGQLVLTKKINTEVKWMDLDISELTPSVYTLQLEQKGSPLYTTKFVVH